jgi:nucleoside-diphosphate-sugar epimerase
MRVAVTGATGFLGRHVVRALADHGHDVLQLGRSGDGEGLAVLVGAQRPERAAPLPDLLAGVQAVAHLAGRRAEGPGTPLADYLRDNVTRTEELLSGMVEAGASRVVYASTRMVYASTLTGALREDCAEPPDTFYGLSKRTAEGLLRIVAVRDGLSALSLRIGQVVGDGDGGRGILPRLIDRAAEGGPLTVHGAGAAVRDFVDVRDVARAFALAVSTETTAPAVNIGGPRPRPIADLARVVAAVAGLGDDAVVSEPTEREDTSDYSLDRSLAREQLGWEPQRSLEETVRDRLGGAGA